MDRLVHKTIAWYIFTYMLVFVMTILLLVPIYDIAYTSTKTAIEHNLTGTLSRNLERLTTELSAVDRFGMLLYENEEVKELSFRNDVRNKHLIEALSLRKRFEEWLNMGTMLADDIVILFADSDYVVSKSIVQTKNKYWGNTLSINGMTQEEFENSLLKAKVAFFPQSRIKTKYLYKETDAICLNYFSSTSTRVYYAASIIISRDSIRDVVMDETVEENGWMKITDAKGNMLFESAADDLGNCTEWTFTSDILPVTMTVGIDNAVFSRSVANVQRTIIAYCLMAFLAVVILTVIMTRRIYSPVREYVNFVKDQKWIDSDKNRQNIRESIYESMRRFSIDSAALNQNLKQMRKEYSDAMLLGLCSSDSDATISQLERCFATEPALGGNYVAVRLYTGENGGTAGMDDMNQAYRFAIDELASNFITYTVQNPRFMAIVKVDGDTADSVDIRLEKICEQIASHQLHHQTILRLARSSIHSGLEELKTACDEVSKIIQNIQPFAKEGCYLLRYEEHIELGDVIALCTFSPNTLYSVLLAGNQDAIAESMSELRSRYSELFLSRPNRAPALYYQVVSVFELVLARMQRHIDIMEYDNTWSVDTTCNYLETIACELGNMVSSHVKKADNADAIIAFIDGHYQDSAICLGMLSTQFKLTEAYISRMIKLKTGSTYSEYVEQLRMRKAIELLDTSNQSVTEIAQALGYETPNTFFKAFKRVYHVSPGVYRSGSDR